MSGGSPAQAIGGMAGAYAGGGPEQGINPQAADPSYVDKFVSNPNPNPISPAAMQRGFDKTEAVQPSVGQGFLDSLKAQYPDRLGETGKRYIYSSLFGGGR